MRRAASSVMPRSLFVALMLGIVYVFWGATSPAMRLAVATLPPWWMAALRFLCAGALLWLYCRLRGLPLPDRGEWRGAALTGTILLVAGNGIFAWTLQYLPSGIGALFFALAPLWMAILGYFMYAERLSPMAIAGLAVGLGGMIYLYSPSGAQDLPTFPTVLGVFTSFAWAFGSMIQRRFTTANVVQFSSMQMLCAAPVLALMALLFEKPLAASQFTPQAIGALLFLIFLGSIVGFSAFVWVLRHVPTTLASTYSYVNPIVALIIGIGFLRERFSWSLAIGAGIIVLGVALMIAAPKREPILQSPDLRGEPSR
jgi:drug/metabolite transporter (DMT)-like permease